MNERSSSNKSIHNNTNNNTKTNLMTNTISNPVDDCPQREEEINEHDEDQKQDDELLIPATTVPTISVEECYKKFLEQQEHYAKQKLSLPQQLTQQLMYENPCFSNCTVNSNTSTGSCASNNSNSTNSSATSISNPQFCIGDHVYQWCSLVGIPGVFQHHGIVLDVSADDGDFGCGGASGVVLTIADFSSVLLHKAAAYGSSDASERSSQEDLIMAPKKNGNKKSIIDFSLRSTRNNDNSNCVNHRKNGYVRVYQDDSNKWNKVNYEASFFQRHMKRSGTCTSVESDAPALVLSRVYFLLEFGSNILPKYNILTSNCECVAVWCKTGNWATLQASTFLSCYAAGQMKSTGTLAAYASTQQVTIPATGLWGYLGYTTKVSLIAAQPYLVPAIATYGAITVGCPSILLWRAKSFWNKTTKELNDQFWQSAIDNPTIFATSMTYWSTKHDAYEKNNSKQRNRNRSKQQQKKQHKFTNHRLIQTS